MIMKRPLCIISAFQLMLLCVLAVEPLDQFKEVLWEATLEVMKEQNLSPAEIEKMRMMGTGSWMKGTAWNPETSDLDLTLGFDDIAKEKKMAAAIEKKAQELAAKRGLSKPDRIHVMPQQTFHPEKFPGPTGEVVFHNYSKKNAPGGKSAFVFDVAWEDGKIVDLKPNSVEAKAFWEFKYGKTVPKSFSQSWRKLDADIDFVLKAQREGASVEDTAKQIAKYLETYNQDIKPGVVNEFAPGKTITALDMPSDMQRQANILYEIKTGGGSLQSLEAELYDAFNVKHGDVDALRAEMSAFNSKAVTFMRDTRDNLEFVEKAGRRGLVNNADDAARVLLTASKIKGILFKSLGAAGLALDVYTIMDAGYNRGLTDGGLELGAALISAGVPPAAIGAMIATLGKEVFVAVGTWAGNALIFDPINEKALESLYFDTNKTAVINLFSFEESPFAVIGATRETLAYHFKDKDVMFMALDAFMARQYGRGFVRAGAADITPMLKAQLARDYAVSGEVAHQVQMRQLKLLAGTEITPLAYPLEVKVDYNKLRVRSRDRSRNFAKNTMVDGRAGFRLHITPSYFERRVAAPKKGKFQLYDAWGRGGTEGYASYIEQNTKVEYMPYKPLEVSLSVENVPGWKVSSSWGSVSPGDSRRISMDLKNPDQLEYKTFAEHLTFTAEETAEKPITANVKLILRYTDAELADRDVEYNFSLTAVPVGKRENRYSVLANVCDKEDGTPVGGATVDLESADWKARDYSSGAGQVFFEDVPFGRFSVKASAMGYMPFEKIDAFNLQEPSKAGEHLLGKATIRLTKLDEVKKEQPLGTDQPENVTAEEPRIVKGAGQASCSFAEVYLPKKSAYAGQKISYEAPGPGSLAVTFKYISSQVTLAQYADLGGYRYYSSLHWDSPSGAVKKGRVVGPGMFTTENGKVIHLKERETHTGISVAKAGTINFTAYPESTPAYIYNGKWVDNWYQATHDHYHGGACEISFKFTGRSE